MDKKTVLIVEDDETYREILIKLLSKEKLNTITASNGKEALEVLKANNVDLILLDIIMPEMGGMMFIYELQKTRHNHVPIILLTNLSHTSYPSDIPVQVDFLTKANVSVDEVVKTVKKRLLLS